MEHEGIQSDAIRGWVDDLKSEILDLAYNDSEDYTYDFNCIVNINELIRDIEREIACLEKSKERWLQLAVDLNKKLMAVGKGEELQVEA